MAIAPYLPEAATDEAVLRDPDVKRDCSPDEILVTTILERSAADVGWLAWGDGKDAVVIPGAARSFLNPSAIGEFPDPRSWSPRASSDPPPTSDGGPGVTEKTR